MCVMQGVVDVELKSLLLMLKYELVLLEDVCCSPRMRNGYH